MIVHLSASVTLTRQHPWHWLSVIYTQCRYAPMTLTICTCDIDWVWFTLSIDMHPLHWLSAPVSLTECDIHLVSIWCTHSIDFSAPVTLTRSLRRGNSVCVNTDYCASVTLTKCIHDIYQWVWLTFTPCACSFQWNTNGNFNEIPLEISTEIHWKYQWKFIERSFEILMKYQI